MVLDSLDAGRTPRLGIQPPQLDTLVIACADEMCELIPILSREELDGLDKLLVSAEERVYSSRYGVLQ